MRKLDWIAKHGGMALVDVHPDYMSFNGSWKTANKYPAALYREFLTYLKTRYAGEYWHALPRDVAKHVTKVRSAEVTEYDKLTAVRTGRLRGRRAAVLLFSYYPSDSRPRRATEALA